MTAPNVMPPWVWGADAESVNWIHIPHGVPVLWPYRTGTPDVIWSDFQVAKIAPHTTIWVEQGFGRLQVFDVDEFDVEAGAITPGQVPAIVLQRHERKMITRLYGTWNTYAQVKEELAYQEALKNVWWRISDWNLSEAMAEAALLGDVYAIQWASPTSNPQTFIPGTKTRLIIGGVDLSVMSTRLLTWQD